MDVMPPLPTIDGVLNATELRDRVHQMIRSFRHLQHSLTPDMQAQAKGLEEEIDTAVTSLSILSLMLSAQQEQAARPFAHLRKS
jgi:hypothetical protein